MEKKAIRVLIIEDDHVDAMILQRHLSCCNKLAVNSEHAADLQQALKKLSYNHFDLIFLDSILGGCVTARDILESFNEENIKTPVVIIPGLYDEQLITELTEIGAAGYIEKDAVSPESLEKIIIDTIERYLRKDRQNQAEIKITKGISRKT